MKLRTNTSSVRRNSGISLIECLVYVAVFGLLLGIGTATFYFCWDHTRAVIITANEVESALRAGECWRADIRAANGTISVETVKGEAMVKIPTGGSDVVYRFSDGELRREIPAQNSSRLLLEKVKVSEMTSAAQSNVTAWHWELELAPRRNETHFPLRFTFEAAQTKP